MQKSAWILCLLPGALFAQQGVPLPPSGWADDPPALPSLVAFARAESDLRVVVVRYAQDVAAVERRYPVQYSPARIARLRKLQEGWRDRLAEFDFDSLNSEGRVDYVALRGRINYEIEKLGLLEARGEQLKSLLPFFDDVRLLEEQRFDRNRVDARTAATTLDRIAKQVTALSLALDEASRPGAKRPSTPAVLAMRAVDQLAELRATLADWNGFYNGYDPVYSWWARKPFADADAALQVYADTIKRVIVGIKPGEPAPIVGDPVLAAGLRADLAVEMIPYSPEELISIGEREFASIEAMFREVARKMGYGDDWKAALEYTKNLAPPPGEAPWAIYDIATYSEDFIARRHNITLAPLAREIWRLAMQSPEQQLVNPFFNGGEVTHLSYPTDSMALDDRLMSMRGNTPHFNFPTVQHELVPGHHLQQFMIDRFNGHRAAISDTPFWTEGWALYWELQLWDANFPRNDPDRIGMLFWRLHRAARIVFSLNYQLGKWSPRQCVDFLVERVGHERANAEAEVRRTTIAPPLYQSAYMLGALQLRALYRELVDSGRMNATDFHDAILLGGPMPVELVRARLAQQPLTRDYRSRWRFYQSLGPR